MTARLSASVEGQLRFDRSAQLKAALIAAAFMALFWNLLDFIPPNLGKVVHRWIHELDWSHGPIIPLFSAYLIHANWDRIRRVPVRHTWVGLVIMLGALGLYQYSLWGVKVFFIQPVAMLLCLLGVIIFLCGLPLMRYAWVPWLYLFFAIPLPKGIYVQLTQPLRIFAANVATGVLSFVPGLEIETRGTTIAYSYQGVMDQIEVADACSGMRSTMTLCALGVAVAFLSERAWWQRIIMVASCIPIAVFCNFIRVTTTSALHIYVDPKYATGTYHMTLGLLLLVVAFGIFNALGWVLNHLTVEEPDADAAEA